MSRPKPEDQRKGHPRGSTKPAKPGPRRPKPLPAHPSSLAETSVVLWYALWKLGLPWTEADEYAVQRYIELRERRANLQAVLDDEGLFTKGSMGQTVAHPALKLIDGIESSIKSLEVQLLMTPDGRARYGIGDDENTELEDWLDEANREFEQGSSPPD